MPAPFGFIVEKVEMSRHLRVIAWTLRDESLRSCNPFKLKMKCRFGHESRHSLHRCIQSYYGTVQEHRRKDPEKKRTAGSGTSDRQLYRLVTNKGICETKSVPGRFNSLEPAISGILRFIESIESNRIQRRKKLNITIHQFSLVDYHGQAHVNHHQGY